MPTPFDTLFPPKIKTLIGTYGKPIKIIREGGNYNVATGRRTGTTTIGTTQPGGEFGRFTALGWLTTPLGEKWPADTSATGEPHMTIRDGTAYLVDGANNSTRMTSKTFDAGDPTGGWPAPTVRLTPNESDPYSSGALDTPGLLWHEPSQRWLCFNQVRPGLLPTAPAGQTYSGHISPIQVAESGNFLDWTQSAVSTAALEPGPFWTQGWIVGTEGINSRWIGGLQESTAVYDPSDGVTRLFFTGLSPESVAAGTASPRRWALGRAEEVPGSNGKQFNYDPINSWVFYPKEDIPEGIFGGGQAGSYHFSVHIDPVLPIYHCVFMVRFKWILHMYSFDKGLTWTVNPNNPLIDLDQLNTDLGLPTGETNGAVGIIGAPWMMFDDTPGGKIYIGFDGDIYQQNDPPSRHSPSSRLFITVADRPTTTTTTTTTSAAAPTVFQLKISPPQGAKRYISQGLAAAGSMSGYIDAADLAPAKPRIGDRVELDGEIYNISIVEPIYLGETIGAYQLVFNLL